MKSPFLVLISFVLVGCASQADLDSALSQVSDLQAQIASKGSEIASLEIDIGKLEDSESSLQGDLESLQSSYSELQVERDDLQSKYDEARSNVTSLTSQVNKLICDDQITDMKYQNILDASTILSAWWARQPGVFWVGGQCWLDAP